MNVACFHLALLAAAALLTAQAPARSQTGDNFADIEEYLLELPAAPEGAGVPVIADGGPGLRARQYPAQSLSRGESGAVGLRFRVEENGRIADIEIVTSIGIQRLENSAIAILRASSFQPAMQNGKPIAVWAGMVVQYVALPSAMNKERLQCHERPIVGFTGPTEQVLMIGTQGRRYDPRTIRTRWMFVNDQGIATIILRHTGAGWRVIGPPAASQTEGSDGFPKPTIPGGCWYLYPEVGTQ
jgi:TonB family protein